MPTDIFKTSKREALAMARLWADSSALPQAVYKRKGEWWNCAQAVYTEQPGDVCFVTVLPAFFFGFLNGPVMRAADDRLRALGLKR